MKATIKSLAVPTYQHMRTLTSRSSVQLDKARPNAVIMLAPDYGNVGDLAIRWAQEYYLRTRLPGFAIHSIPLSKTYDLLRSIRRQMGPSDIVFLVGGGSTGNLYPLAQRGREFIVGYLKDQKIICFPQSLIYSDDIARRTSGAREAKALARNPNLTLCAREAASYKQMRSHFSNKVIFAPDIVFSLLGHARELPRIRREGALVILRNDGERERKDLDDFLIHTVLGETFTRTKFRDNTVPDSQVKEADIPAPVQEMLKLHRSAELVITDRLHGMIFAAITGTPCVAISNSNHKVSATYDAWLKNKCPYVEYINVLSDANLRATISRVTSPAAKAVFNSIQFNFYELDEEIREADEEPTRSL